MSSTWKYQFLVHMRIADKVHPGKYFSAKTKPSEQTPYDRSISR